MSQYHEDLPAQCPPGHASNIYTQLYKAINGRQPSQRDFMSFAEQGRHGVDRDDCQSWGLSVWPSMGAVEHALKAYKFFTKKPIIRFAITPDDGALVISPSAKQPEHHTFWKHKSCNLLNSCEIVIPPEGTP